MAVKSAEQALSPLHGGPKDTVSSRHGCHPLETKVQLANTLPLSTFQEVIQDRLAEFGGDCPENIISNVGSRC